MQLERIPPDWVSREGVGLAAGIVVGVLLRDAARAVFRRLRSGGSRSVSNLGAAREGSGGLSARGEHKLVLCVRTDLKMQKGKIAAQVGHATLGAYKEAAEKYPSVLKAWERNAQPKIALQIGSMAQARQLESAASGAGLATYMVYDAGRTQIAAGSMTVLAIGPGPVNAVNAVTGKLKLL